MSAELRVLALVLTAAAYILLVRWTRRRRRALGIGEGTIVSADDSLIRAPTLRSARLGLVGRCDHLLRVGDAYVPVEQKPSARRLRQSHMLQVGSLESRGVLGGVGANWGYRRRQHVIERVFSVAGEDHAQAYGWQPPPAEHARGLLDHAPSGNCQAFHRVAYGARLRNPPGSVAPSPFASTHGCCVSDRVSARGCARWLWSSRHGRGAGPSGGAERPGHAVATALMYGWW